jgi:hypothetical protein
VPESADDFKYPISEPIPLSAVLSPPMRLS